MPRELDPWVRLRPTTPARIGLARSGDALALPHVLELQLGHARARDAVHVPMDVERVAVTLVTRVTHDSVRVHSRAQDRATYLRRPDLGRRLDPACLDALKPGDWDAAFVIADGLSSFATESHAVDLLAATMARLPEWRIAPIVVATQARVALADEIGERLGARLVAILIGERPGLSAADSLGVYLTCDPRVGRRDSERNCISNIHGGGLPVDAAAGKLAWLMTEARQRGVTGVALKDEMPEVLDAGSSKEPAGSRKRSLKTHRARFLAVFAQPEPKKAVRSRGL